MAKFAVWNRAMHRVVYEAATAKDALEKAVAAGHIERTTSYRKYEEVR